jgi:hydrogenase maturation factor
MRPAPPSAALGKIAPEVFARDIAPHLGASRGEVLVGPRAGHDAAIVRVGAGRVLALTTDPLSLVPALGPEHSAWAACHLLASDLWTTAVPPAYVSVSLALPPGLEDAVFARYWRAMSAAWAELGVAVVTGHTGRYEGCDLSILGAATLVGVGDDGRWLTPAMARPGDAVLVTKGCAIETAAVAAAAFPERLRAALADDTAFERLVALRRQTTVVPDCRAALRVGIHDRGVTALHDATEGGVLGGLSELAHACGHDLRIERARIPLAPEVATACSVLGVDPYASLAEGALIATVAPAHRDAVLAALAAEGIAAACVGEVVKGGGGRLWLAEPDGSVTRLDAPAPDPYWPAYARALREGWR